MVYLSIKKKWILVWLRFFDGFVKCNVDVFFDLNMKRVKCGWIVCDVNGVV